MADNLKIGATVDKAGIEEGFSSVQDLTQKVTQKLAISFEECSARTKGAMRGISDDVKEAAATVSEESLKIAEATKLQADAMADLRRANIIARDSNIDAAVSTGILAAAQNKAAVAAAGLAAAKAGEAAAVVEASEEEGLSANWIIAGFQRAAISVSESMAEVREQLVETAETGELSAEGMSAGFAGLGSLLGAGLLLGFGAHFLDELAKVNVELDHLSAKTGISATSLAGLQQIVKEAGGDWDAVSTGLVKMDRAQAQVQEGNKKTAKAFADLGISVKEVASSKPEELLDRVAVAMAGMESHSKLVNAAIGVFGKGGAALIPILREQGSALEANTAKAGALTGVTEDSIAAARRWTQDTARLATQFRSVLMPVMEHAVDVISGVAGAFEAAASAIVTVAEVIGAAFTSVGAELVAVGKLYFDVMSGNAGAILADTVAVKTAFTDQWKGAFRDIGDAWKEVGNRFKDPGAAPKLPEMEGDGDGKIDPAQGKKVTAVERDEEQLNEIRREAAERGTVVGTAQEIRFWEAKLATASKGSEEYRQILAKLVPLEEKQAEKKTPKIETETEDAGLKEYEREWMEANEAVAKSDEEAAKRGVAAYRSAREEEVRLASESYRDAEKDSQAQVQLGKMTAEQRIQYLKAASDEEYRVKKAAIDAMELLDLGNAEAYQADLNKELQATREQTRQIADLNNQAALKVHGEWQKTFDTMNADITKVMNSWLEGSRNMTMVFVKMFDTILTQLADFVLKWLLKKAELWAEEKILTALGLTAQRAEQGVGNVAAVVGDAAVAAAGTLAYYSAINPVIAPAMAEAAYATTMTYAPMAAMAAGGVVGGQSGMAVPILAHAGERVLTPQQTQNFERMANGTGAAVPGRGDVHTHLHYNGQVNAYDRSGMRSTLKAHAEDILDVVRDGYRNGLLA